MFPAAREQRCWVHVTANVLAALPKRLQPDAKAAIAKIYSAETRADAITAARAFGDEFAEHPKATKKITGKLDTLLAFYDQGNPNTTPPESEQQPGLRIEFDPGGNCTWGANGHTSSYNYMVFAGHCGPDPSFLGWSDSVEIHQNNSFHLTPGSQFFYSKTDSGWDMERASSPQADSNCYHAVGSCVRYIRWRALHNSWETNSDLVCASLGNTNDYECGLILEEYSTPPSSCTIGNRAVRYDIDTGGGDSGSGLIGPVGTGVTIDAIHTCGDGTEALGQTAYDVKNQLAFDYNCASSKVTGRSAGNWGSCPTYNR